MFPRFYASESAFPGIHHSLKHRPCPHCGKTGTLNLHGYLKGYYDTGGKDKMIRGHRVYCSNRHRRTGCGRTVSILLAACIKNFTLSAASLWQFLCAVSKNGNKRQSFARLNLPFSPTTVYRIHRRVCERQAVLRALLLPLCPPPATLSRSPLAQTIRHLQSAFNNAPCPLSALQLRLQISLL